MAVNIHNHRDGWSTYCPFCGFHQDGNEWFKQRYEVLPSTKDDQVVVLTYCPKCGEISWAHFGIGKFEPQSLYS